MGRQGAVEFCLFVAIAMFPATRCFGDVTIEQKPVVVEHKTFDPAHRPSEMPALKQGEAAVTETRFDCDADLTYKVVDRNPTSAGCTATLRVQSVHLTLILKIIVWLPTSAPAKLAAHEDGHKQIDQRIYEEAKSIAEKEGNLLDGQAVNASAADCATAENKATQSAAEGVCRRYLDAVGRRTERINQLYDDITSHGTKLTPGEDKAVEQAFDCEHQNVSGRSPSVR